jgi:plasmid stability protein
MIRTQISLSDDQMRRAKAEAARRGVSLAAIVRQALDEMLDGEGRAAVIQRAREAVGGFRSGFQDTSDRHDEVLAERTRW